MGLPFLFPRIALADGEFVDIAAGLIGVDYGTASWGDFDNDGLLDVLVAGCTDSFCLEYATKVYRNTGSSFVDINANLPGVGFASAAWGDHDNDGFLDIVLTGQESFGPSSGVFRNNGDGTFSNVGAGLVGVHSGSVAYGDYDDDGFLDIALAGDTGAGGAARIYRNRGDGSFVDIGAGLPDLKFTAVAWGDYDNDGRLDLAILGFDGAPVTRLYHNDGGNVFHDIGAALVQIGYGSVAWGDYDNDGRLDLLLTGSTAGPTTTRLYHNDGNGVFAQVTLPLPAVSYGTVAWGDYNNDGRLDILVAGSEADENPKTIHLFRNDGGGSFSEIPLGDLGFWARAVAWGDYDNDGRLDVLALGSTGLERAHRPDVSHHRQPRQPFVERCQR
jgi:hypothetical protein